MSKPAKSVFVFGIYLIALGAVLIATPNTLLSVFGLPSTSEVWIRVIGMFALLLAFYYIQSARKEISDFFPLTVYARASVIVFFSAFVLFGFVSPTLILFGVVDLLGAIWTGMALRSAKSA